MKSILLHIGDDNGLEARVQAALDLARAFDGHVLCQQSVSYETFAPGDMYGTALTAVIPVMKEAAEELRAKLEADLANEDVSWEWDVRYGNAAHLLLEASAISDVIVVGAHGANESQERASRLVGELTTHARTPVLVVPQKARRLDVAGPAMVAWNGSTEACIALRAAVPLLKRANSVYLVTVSEERERERYDVPPVSGAEYLSRHGIEAEMIDIPRGAETIAETLFEAAETRKCAYMVMGAYGHSRLAEMLLGGVTRRVLTDPKLPILLAH
ncbi:universal stress protein [Altererythrobacter arenosus]|uniref:Universal stress protein n=1 Tax=Altererythrobacter arenosus TaxID=3032592 RepID=A0ABY8FU61_9SPHN|nr:universal stress protein [Altererythrobacter sp. CAU 1644]WFL77630.1 universal stress protein [Altererythrobacter sp. CAU 1644]